MWRNGNAQICKICHSRFNSGRWLKHKKTEVNQINYKGGLAFAMHELLVSIFEEQSDEIILSLKEALSREDLTFTQLGNPCGLLLELFRMNHFSVMDRHRLANLLRLARLRRRLAGNSGEVGSYV